MTIKHTPGPWEASFTDCLGGPASYCRIRPVSGEMFGYFTSLEIATMNIMGEAEQQANARLIAAAPELLEALSMCVASMKSCLPDFNPHDQAAYDAAMSAIAKATGDE